MTVSAQGRDFSSYQAPVSPAMLTGLSFAAARVSNWQPGGAMGIDPDFAHNWAAFKKAGLVRLAYWYLLPSADPVAQARFFVDAVCAEGGFEPGDILVCDSEVQDPAADEATRVFCAEVEAILPGAIAAVYTDQVTGRTLASCTRWPLWLAWPSPTAPGPAQCAPWDTWTFWQYGQIGGIDADAYNGTTAELRAWISARTQDSPEDDPVYIPLPAGAKAHIPVWPLAGSAGLPVPWRNATIVACGQDGAVVDAWVHYQDGRTAKSTLTLAAGQPALVEPGSLRGVAAVHLERADATSAACSAVLSRW